MGPRRLGRTEKRPDSTHWQARKTVAQDTGKARPDSESGNPRQGWLGDLRQACADTKPGVSRATRAKAWVAGLAGGRLDTRYALTRVTRVPRGKARRRT